jgi:hypothetical protein
VIIFRLRNARRPAIVARLATALGSVGADLARGAVVVIEQTRHRVRLLPVGER